MVRPIGNAKHLNPSPDDTWGLHILDMNGLFGDLQRAVAGQTRAYLQEARASASHPAAALPPRARRRCARPPDPAVARRR